jgi:hypothetical protein
MSDASGSPMSLANAVANKRRYGEVSSLKQAARERTDVLLQNRLINEQIIEERARQKAEKADEARRLAIDKIRA